MFFCSTRVLTLAFRADRKLLAVLDLFLSLAHSLIAIGVRSSLQGSMVNRTEILHVRVAKLSGCRILSP